MKNHTKYFALPLVTLSLLLSACGGQDDATPTVPLGKGPQATSATQTETANSSASAMESAETAETAEASDVAKPTLASGQEVELTEEEWAAYRAGEYVPANEKHPAYNVPKPVLPEAAKERTAEGAAAFVEYWAETINYTVETGDPAYAYETTSENFESHYRLYKAIEKHYAEGSWSTGAEYSVTALPDTFKHIGGNQSIVDVIFYEAPGKSYDKYGEHSEDLSEQDYNKQPLALTLEWLDEDGSWRAYEISGKAGIDYGL